jgi:hypothetical protein
MLRQTLKLPLSGLQLNPSNFLKQKQLCSYLGCNLQPHP